MRSFFLSFRDGIVALMQWISPALAASYSVVALTSYALPGPDMAVIIPQAMASRRLGFATAAGVQSGMLVHCALAIAGVGTLIVANPGVLGAVQVLGGLYLVWLGLSDLRSAAHGRPVSHDKVIVQGPVATGVPLAYLTGAGANVLNPKAILFFVAILPQFVPPGAPPVSTVAQLAVIDILIGLIVWMVLILLCTRLSRATNQDRSQRVSALIMGTILVVLGSLFVARTFIPLPL